MALKNHIAQWDIILVLLASEFESNLDRNSIKTTMSYLLSNEGAINVLKSWLNKLVSLESPTRLKSEELAVVLRENGNDKFKVGQHNQSYISYTKSILVSPWTGKNFSLALGNRSAALLHLEKYKECILDIRLALQYGYPAKQIYKLYIREAECHLYLSDLSEAERALDIGSEYLQRNPLIAENAKNEVYSNINGLRKRIAFKKMGNTSSDSREIVMPDVLKGHNENFMCASSCLTVQYSSTKGRHVIANEDIQRGDVLFVENPYAFITLSNYENILHSNTQDQEYLYICEKCCESGINPVPCRDCSVAIYCCDECRTQAWSEFHQWECKGAQCDLWHTIGIAHLALRVLLVWTSSEEQLSDKPQNLSVDTVLKMYASEDKIKCFSKEGKAFSRVFNLVTNFENMALSDFSKYALTAVLLVAYLENFTKYFEYLEKKYIFRFEIGELKLLIASLLLQNMGQLVCNGHAITGMNHYNMALDMENVTMPRDIFYYGDIRLATAIYPSVSMLNHSCDPNIISSFYKSTLIVKAARSIPKGSEVLNCYGPNYMRIGYQERQDQLKAQYLFDCCCDACLNPEKANFSYNFTAYSCHKCKGPVWVVDRMAVCKQCKDTDHNLEEFYSLVTKADEFSKQASSLDSSEEKFNKLSNALKLRQQCLHRHHVSIRENMDEIANLLAVQGEYTKSIDMIKQCIPTLEHQFGSFSIEVAHELLKLSDITFARVMNSTEEMKAQPAEFRAWCMESQKITKKAIQLFDLNYGLWNPSHENLQAKLNIVGKILTKNRHITDDVQGIHNMMHYNLRI